MQDINQSRLLTKLFTEGGEFVNPLSSLADRRMYWVARDYNGEIVLTIYKKPRIGFFKDFIVMETIISSRLVNDKHLVESVIRAMQSNLRKK